MIVRIFSGRYGDPKPLEKYLSDLFGYGKASVTYKRGKFNCTVPRNFTKHEEDTIEELLKKEHYS